jgi:hypothetical protein
VCSQTDLCCPVPKNSFCSNLWKSFLNRFSITNLAKTQCSKMKNFSIPNLCLAVLCLDIACAKFVHVNTLASSSRENCNVKLRQKYCLEDVNCLRCDVGPKCHVNGQRQVSESKDGTLLLRGEYLFSVWILPNSALYLKT